MCVRVLACVCTYWGPCVCVCLRACRHCECMYVCVCLRAWCQGECMCVRSCAYDVVGRTLLGESQCLWKRVLPRSVCGGGVLCGAAACLDSCQDKGAVMQFSPHPPPVHQSCPNPTSYTTNPTPSPPHNKQNQTKINLPRSLVRMGTLEPKSPCPVRLSLGAGELRPADSGYRVAGSGTWSWTQSRCGLDSSAPQHVFSR